MEKTEENYAIFRSLMKEAERQPSGFALSDWCDGELSKFSCTTLIIGMAECLHLDFNCSFGEVCFEAWRHADDRREPEFEALSLTLRYCQDGMTYSFTLKEDFCYSERDKVRMIKFGGDDYDYQLLVSLRMLATLKFITSYPYSRYCELPANMAMRSLDNIMERRSRIHMIYDCAAWRSICRSPRSLFGWTRVNGDYYLLDYFNSNEGEAAIFPSGDWRRASVQLEVVQARDDETQYNVKAISTSCDSKDIFPRPKGWHGQYIESIKFDYEGSKQEPPFAQVNMNKCYIWNRRQETKQLVQISRKQADDIVTLLECIRGKNDPVRNCAPKPNPEEDRYPR